MEFFKALFKLVVVVFFAFILSAWSTMQVVAGLHHLWWSDMPTMGYSTACKFTVWVFGIALVVAFVQQLVAKGLYAKD